MIVFILNRIRYFIFFAFILLFSCIFKDSGFDKTEKKARDLAQILTEGKIVAVTDFKSTNYFIYKGEPMGYKYEMLVALAANLGVKLELIAENSPEESLKMLRNGEVDVIVNDISEITTNTGSFTTTEPYRKTSQVLVQRKRYAGNGNSVNIIRNLNDLEGKKIFVQGSSISSKTLKNLVQENGISLKIEEDTKNDAEHLFDLVASGSIDYVVCDYDVARVQSTIYSNIDIETPIGATQDLTWAVNSGSPDLLLKVNEWLEVFPKTVVYSSIYSKYFDNPYMAIIKKSDFFYSTKGKLSIFDEQIKSESGLIDWDWRLVASLIYQESKFNPTVRSESGAYGLMQFMPVTAEHFGIDHEAKPSVQLKMGVRYLKMLDKYLQDIRIPDRERLKFVLAAYNAGYGHIIDARNLARKYGKDPNVWDNNVAFFIQNKVEFYNDTVVRHGYLRGSETYKYVNEILERYDHYKNIIKQ